MSLRTVRTNKLIKQEIGKIILYDINFQKDILVTVTEVKTSADLRYANVAISVFPDKKDDGVKKTLNENICLIQQKLNKKLFMKSVPKIRFKIDKRGEYVDRINKLVKKTASC